MTNAAPRCPHCQSAAVLVNGLAIYPRRPDLKALKFWQCAPCDAYVGCHKPGAWVETRNGRIASDGTLPLGRLADAELRRAKKAAHAAFDVFWFYEDNKTRARRAAYARLAEAMGIEVHDCHIGEFDAAKCRQVRAIVNGWDAQELANGAG